MDTTSLVKQCPVTCKTGQPCKRQTISYCLHCSKCTFHQDGECAKETKAILHERARPFIEAAAEKERKEAEVKAYIKKKLRESQEDEAMEALSTLFN